MKKNGLLNPHLCAAVARLGYTQTFAVADAGLLIPRDVPVIDLALILGVPRFQEVFDAILDEVVVEGATIAHEALGHEPESWVKTGSKRFTRSVMRTSRRRCPVSPSWYGRERRPRIRTLSCVVECRFNTGAAPRSDPDLVLGVWSSRVFTRNREIGRGFGPIAQSVRAPP